MNSIMMTVKSFGLCAFIALLSLNVNGIREFSRPKHDKVVVCYVASWAAYRPGRGQFQFENLRPQHCTHLIYSFAGLNATTSTIRSLDPWADLEENYGKGTYRKMTGLKNQYPGLKVSLAIGGWNEESANYSALAASPQKRNIFVKSVVEYLREYGFDGLDLDWEFPGKRGGAPYDKENFASLVKELSNVLKSRKLLLTAAISADRATINIAYDIPSISEYLDFIHVMAYDYHGAWDRRVLPNAPLKCNQDDLCVESTINHLIKLGAPMNKLVLGLPMYGRTFILTRKLNNNNNDNENPIGTESLEKGFQGNYTREDGFMGYNEICMELVQSSPGSKWRTGWDEQSKSAWMVHEDKAIVYDNVNSFFAKIEFLKNVKLAGIMVWSIDTDDFKGDCTAIHNNYLLDDPPIGGSIIDYPLMRTINMALSKFSKQDDSNSISDDKSFAVAAQHNLSVYYFNCIFFHSLVLMSLLNQF